MPINAIPGLGIFKNQSQPYAFSDVHVGRGYLFTISILPSGQSRPAYGVTKMISSPYVFFFVPLDICICVLRFFFCRIYWARSEVDLCHYSSNFAPPSKMWLGIRPYCTCPRFPKKLARVKKLASAFQRNLGSETRLS
ncbi:hypothetical protein HYPSUDRAFT_47325, partial [Hypholoma sublateritium FD-334 SS-4]